MPRRSATLYISSIDAIDRSLRDPLQTTRLRAFRSRQRLWSPHQMATYMSLKSKYSDIFHARPPREDYEETGGVANGA